MNDRWNGQVKDGLGNGAVESGAVGGENIFQFVGDGGIVIDDLPVVVRIVELDQLSKNDREGILRSNVGESNSSGIISREQGLVIERRSVAFVRIENADGQLIE